MVADEKIITQAIVDRYFEKLKETLSVDVTVVEGGPSGLVCSYFIANSGFKVIPLPGRRSRRTSFLQPTSRPLWGMLLSGEKVASLITEEMRR